MNPPVVVKSGDMEYEDKTIVKTDGQSITTDDGWSFLVPESSPITPRAGMMARLYGRGIGYPVRGLDLDGVEVFYRTPEQQQQHVEHERLEREQAQNPPSHKWLQTMGDAEDECQSVAAEPMDNPTAILLERVEQQAVRISELEREVEHLRGIAERMSTATRENLLRLMARAAVNCGQHYGCWLASDMLGDDL